MTSPSTESRKTILILGASYSGISTAHSLLKHAVPKLSTPAAYQVVLVSPSTHVMCRPACPRALISDDFFNQEKLFVPVEKQFAQYPAENFRFIHGSAISWNQADRIVSVALAENAAVEEIHFHALVIATGASTPSPLLGFSPGQGHEELQQYWKEFRKLLPAAKSIVIAGGGPSGIETAAELGEHLNGRAGWFSSKLDKPKVQITVICASERILPVLRPGLAKKAEDLLAKVGVVVRKSTRVVNVSSEASKKSITLSSGETLEADLYIPATGTKPNTAFVPKELLATDERIETNSQTLRVDNAGPRVYSIGDCCSAHRPAVHNVLAGIPILAANIKRDLKAAEGDSNPGSDRTFEEDKRETQLVPIGKKTGVGAAMGWALPGWMVWLIKGRDYWIWTTGNLWSGKQWAKEA